MLEQRGRQLIQPRPVLAKLLKRAGVALVDDPSSL